jgi:hypothetical protein
MTGYHAGYILTHHLDHEGSLGRNIASGDENLAQVVEESGNTQLGIVWPDRNDVLRRGFGGVDIGTVTLLA